MMTLLQDIGSVIQQNIEICQLVQIHKMQDSIKTALDGDKSVINSI